MLRPESNIFSDRDLEEGELYLLPHQPVQGASIPLSELREHLVLQQPVVDWTSHVLVPVKFQTKGSVSPMNRMFF